MRVFILGAGFSKAAGFPLATELTSLLLRERSRVFGSEPDGEMEQWVKSLQERIVYLERLNNGNINIEKFFHLGYFDAELHRMRHQLCPVGRSYGDTPYQYAKDVDHWLRKLESALIGVIWNCREKANTSSISNWCESLQNDDVIVSFNYDTLIENSLRRLERPWHHGIENAAGGSAILKLHGSIDWLVFEQAIANRGEHYELLYRKPNKDEFDEQPEDYSELRRVNDDEDLTREVRDLGREVGKKFGIAGLGLYKPLHDIPGLILPWHKTCDAIAHAEEIIIIGFSLSPFDAMAQLRFAEAMMARDSAPSVYLVDPNAHELKPRFEAVFGQVQEFKTPWESLDWGTFPK